MVMNKILNEYETPIPASPQETTLTQRLVSIRREFNFAKSSSADTLVITLIAAWTSRKLKSLNLEQK